jgi:hypothetical protein
MVNHRRGESVMINQRIGNPIDVHPATKYGLIWYSTSILGSWRSPIEPPRFFRIRIRFLEVAMMFHWGVDADARFHSIGTGSRNGRGIFHGDILILVPQRSPKSYHRWEMNGNRWNRITGWVFYCCSMGSAIAVRNETLKTPWMAQIRWSGGRFKKKPTRTRTYPNFWWVKQCHTPPSRLGIVTIPPIVIWGMVYGIVLPTLLHD